MRGRRFKPRRVVCDARTARAVRFRRARRAGAGQLNFSGINKLDTNCVLYGTDAGASYELCCSAKPGETIQSEDAGGGEQARPYGGAYLFIVLFE